MHIYPPEKIVVSAVLLNLPRHLAIPAERATALALDDAFGISQIAPGRRGFLIFSMGSPPRFAPNASLLDGVESGPLALPPEMVQETARIGLAIADAIFEVAFGAWRGGRTHLRLVDVLRADGTDVRSKPLLERHKKMSELRRRIGWRLELLESSALASGQGKAYELHEGPGRPGTLLAFRRLSGRYGEDWLVAPAEFRIKIPKKPEVEFGQPLPPPPHPLFARRS